MSESGSLLHKSAPVVEERKRGRPIINSIQLEQCQSASEQPFLNANLLRLLCCCCYDDDDDDLLYDYLRPASWTVSVRGVHAAAAGLGLVMVA